MKCGEKMKISQMGFKNVKLNDLNEMYPAQDILLKTGQIKQYGSGVFGMDNIVLRVQDNIENLIKKHFDKVGGIEVQMPLIQQKELWERSNRYEKYVKDGVMLTVKTEKGDYCLAPTAEEAITYFIENRVTSHNQLPVYLYQIGTKFRNEIRNRGYLYRGKEFNMFDLYTFDKTIEDMEKAYAIMKNTYFDFFNEIGLQAVAVAADNGAIGGSISEEIMVISNSGEDTILYDKENKIGLNEEVLEKDNYEKYLKDNYNITNIDSLEKLKALELGHIFALGEKYSESMNIKYCDENNNIKNFQMGCYGIGVSRVLGCIYENNTLIENGKVVGFSLPLSVTPYYAYIIYSNQKENQAYDLYNQLIDKDLKVIIDDSNNSIGSKIRNAKVLGIPYIVILGNNTYDDMCEIEQTKTENKNIFSLKEAVEKISEIQKTKKDINL